MNDDFEELFRQFLAEAKAGKNCYAMERPTFTCTSENQLCGDSATIFVKLAKDKIVEASFLSKGCALVQISSALMTEQIKGISVPDARSLAADFIGLFSQPDKKSRVRNKLLSGLAENVRNFPQRIPCVCLPWKALVERDYS